jgi:hypothetical protein
VRRDVKSDQWTDRSGRDRVALGCARLPRESPPQWLRRLAERIGHWREATIIERARRSLVDAGRRQRAPRRRLCSRLLTAVPASRRLHQRLELGLGQLDLARPQVLP